MRSCLLQDRTICVLNCSICSKWKRFTILMTFTKVPIIILFCLTCGGTLEAILTVAISPDSKFLLSGSKDRHLEVFDLQTKGRPGYIWDFSLGNLLIFLYMFIYCILGSVQSIVISSQSQFFVAAYETGSIKLFDLPTRQELHLFKKVHTGSFSRRILKWTLFIGAILSIVISNDDKFLISGSQDKSIKVFDLATKQEIHHIPNAHEGIILIPVCFC